ncbi:hypothetical protein [Melittangium boletus]|uniref:Primosomal protein N' (Replication factor Y)-superfamily II helicase n=1 Tax=Melittangium boletus DSM 14713 TaxID=1294270 RepID=A0A250IED9_9BACT|nr:hypothetical protein [Melittangium boletus]ATB29608.1 hypothetical protein MEBOL_003063 [Melittangium boletus DSM 14713]
MNLRCQSCGAELVVAPELRTTVCPYCAAPSVVERPPSVDRPEPVFTLGFALTHQAAGERVKAWLRSRHPWTHSGLKRAPLQDVRGVYVPAWLYSARAESEYSASIGEDYRETETYTTTENGKTVTKTRTVTKTEWRSLRGAHAEYVPDVLVTASRGLPNAELEALEPFDLRALARYEPGLVAGWVTEEPSLAREECLAQARAEAEALVARRLAAFMPGDSHRDLRYQMRLEEESLDVCLVPVWVLAARYAPNAPPLRVVVNGQTGEVYGNPPVSWVKVALTVLTVVALGVGLYFLLRGHS